MFLALLGFAILFIMYALLVLEVMHRTAVALLAASIVFALNIVLRFSSFEELLLGVDIDTILLLMSMMIIVGVLSRTGVFEYIAAIMLRKFHAHPLLLTSMLSAMTALISAFIDNVTTVLLVTPIVIEMFRRVGVDPRPVLLSIVFASNIGGTATLIGDPPNIIIGSVAGLGFMDFIRNLTPIVVVDLALFIILTKALYRKWLTVYSKRMRVVTEFWTTSIDRSLLKRVEMVLGLVIGLFFLEDLLGYPPAIPAMIGAGITMLFIRKRMSIDEVLKFVDWSTLLFFIAMFIAIKGIEKMGVMSVIAQGVVAVSNNLIVLLMVILWLSALVSALIDNIPFVMAMIPVIREVTQILSIDPTPLYWALSLGACLGGNATPVGASANIVVVGIAEKYGYHVSFSRICKVWYTRYAINRWSCCNILVRYAL